MEAITIGGLAVLAAGFYFSVVDFVNDLGIRRVKETRKSKKSDVSRLYSIAPQTGIKKMAGMHV